MIIPIMISMNPEITRIPNKDKFHVLHYHSAALTSLNQRSQFFDFSYEPIPVGLTVNGDVHRHTAATPIEVGPDGGAGGFGEVARGGVIGSHYVLYVLVLICDFCYVLGFLTFAFAF